MGAPRGGNSNAGFRQQGPARRGQAQQPMIGKKAKDSGFQNSLAPQPYEKVGVCFFVPVWLLLAVLLFKFIYCYFYSSTLFAVYQIE